MQVLLVYPLCDWHIWRFAKQHRVKNGSDTIYVAMLSYFAWTCREQLIHICRVLVYFAVVEISDFLKIFANLLLLWRNKLSVSSAHIVFKSCFLDIRQINFQNLFRIPISMVEVKEAHFIDLPFF